MTDVEWAVLEPLLPSTSNRCGRWRDHRQVINWIFHRFSTGAQWRELPERFGPGKTVHKRHLPWSADGTWERLLQHVQAQADPRATSQLVRVDGGRVHGGVGAEGAPGLPPGKVRSLDPSAPPHAPSGPAER
ncbi:transposase [Streptomyces sp. A73]|uniref:transposase n=1 Tax=Streptomyces smyrnaeus TaxID=1387713 RepID=UPI001B371D12|nr:transposase [Streptomyces sp. RK75]MBQ1120676.1 transposase [Streptomyces sp. B15]MBQ1157482.1 transposase [Streptomyces sp. A73]